MPVATTTLAIAAIGASVIGGATSIIGGMGAASAQKDIIAGEQRLEAERLKAMELKSARERIQVLRDEQQKHSIALMHANNQGAIQSSGLLGGFAGIAGGAGFNLAGINKNTQIGEETFDINQSISSSKQDLASWMGVQSVGQGLSSMGNSLTSAATGYSKLSQGLGANPFGGGAVKSGSGWVA